MSDSQRSEAENRQRTKGLLGTDDAMVWAEEFCRIFNGAIVGTPHGNVSGAQVYLDEGTMVGWFANAMGVGESFYRQRCLVKARRNADDTIEIVGDMPSEIVITRELLELMIDHHNRSIRGINVPDEHREKFMEGFNEGEA